MCINRSVAAVAFLVLGLAASTSHAQFSVAQQDTEDYRVGVRLTGWKPTPEELVVNAGPDGTDVDLAQQFAFDAEWARDIQVVLKTSRKSKLRLEYLSLNHGATTTVTQPFVIGGQTFDATGPSTALFEWTMARVGYEYDFVSTPRGYAGAIAEVLFSKVTADLSHPGGSSLSEAQAPIPALGGIISLFVVPRELSITVEVTGMKVPRILDRFEGDMLNVDAFASLFFGRHVAIEAGYRSFDVTYIVDDDSGRIKENGFYVGANVRF